MLNNKNYAIMKSSNPMQTIFRVEYRNFETGKTEAKSIFFQYKEDAEEYARCKLHINCTPHICKYWLK